MLFDYFGSMMVCNDCGEKFHSDDANRRLEYVDDSGKPDGAILICPFCGSDDIEEWEEPEEEEEDMKDIKKGDVIAFLYNPFNLPVDMENFELSKYPYVYWVAENPYGDMLKCINFDISTFETEMAYLAIHACVYVGAHFDKAEDFEAWWKALFSEQIIQHRNDREEPEDDD